MVPSLSISADAVAGLKAAAGGVELETYAARHFELIASPSKSLKEISGPIAKEFVRSGTTED